MIVHVSLYIDGMLNKVDSYLAGMLACKETGQELTGSEVREYLSKEKSAGRSYFCGCDNRLPDGSCAGHEDDE